jgi:acyl phosphate:glycerol-3-phosphate acyltransferase
VLQVLLAAIAGYTLGCLNTGYYLVRVRTGRDLRAEGSGTAGATNAGRFLGRAGFGLALLGDLVKGSLAVGAALALGAGEAGAAAAAVGVVTGHIHPVQLGFRGGKGLATTLGAAVVLAPVPAAVAALVAVAMLVATRRRVLAALSGVAAAPLSALALRGPGPVAAGLAVVAAVVLARHALARRSTPAPRTGPASPGAD